MPSILPTNIATAVGKPLSELLLKRIRHMTPTWSLHEIRARIMGLRRETSDTVSLLLAPNGNWRGFRSGQQVTLSVEIGGVTHTRTFAISSSPRSGIPLRVTVRRRPNDAISRWVMDSARRNDIVTIGPAHGSFVLPPNVGDVLFIAGGAGITPIMSMVRDLVYGGHTDQITCMCYARSEIIFHSELDMLTHEFLNLNFVPYLTADRITSHELPRLSLDEVATVHPSWQQSETFVCGPGTLTRAASEIWESHGLAQRLHVASGIS